MNNVASATKATQDGSGNTITSYYLPKANATSKGSATQPVYFNSSGVATPTTYALNATVPSGAVFTDTKNTAGATNSTEKLYLIGATSQSANPQTYSNKNCYIESASYTSTSGTDYDTSLTVSSGAGTTTTPGSTLTIHSFSITQTKATGTSYSYGFPSASGTFALTSDITKSAVGLGNVVNAGQDSTPTASSTNYVTSGGVKTYVDNAVSTMSKLRYQVVTSLPTASASTMGVIYLVAHSHGSSDGYDEYITLQSGTTYSWEKIGNTDIDLTNYVQKSAVTSKGSATQPVYFDASGAAQPISYTIAKSVPSTAVFTDTTNTVGATNNTSSMLYFVGVSGAATAAQSYANTNIYAQGDVFYAGTVKTNSLVAGGGTIETYDSTTSASAEFRVSDGKLTFATTSKSTDNDFVAGTLKYSQCGGTGILQQDSDEGKFVWKPASITVTSDASGSQYFSRITQQADIISLHAGKQTSTIGGSTPTDGLVLSYTNSYLGALGGVASIGGYQGTIIGELGTLDSPGTPASYYNPKSPTQIYGSTIKFYQGSYTATLPQASGTLALTSDIPTTTDIKTVIETYPGVNKTGTVTSITADSTYLTGGTITSSGTIGVNTSKFILNGDSEVIILNGGSSTTVI